MWPSVVMLCLQQQLKLKSQAKHFKEWMQLCPFDIQSVTQTNETITINLQTPFISTDSIIEELVINDPLFTTED